MYFSRNRCVVSILIKLFRVKAASLHIVFIEHFFSYGVRRAAAISRVLLIDCDGDNDPSAYVCAPPFPSGRVELQPDSAIAFSHVSFSGAILRSGRGRHLLGMLPLPLKAKLGHPAFEVGSVEFVPASTKNVGAILKLTS